MPMGHQEWSRKVDCATVYTLPLQPGSPPHFPDAIHPGDQKRAYSEEPRCNPQIRPKIKHAHIGQLSNCREARAQREGDLPQADPPQRQGTVSLSPLPYNEREDEETDTRKDRRPDSQQHSAPPRHQRNPVGLLGGAPGRGVSRASCATAAEPLQADTAPHCFEFTARHAKPQLLNRNRYDKGRFVGGSRLRRRMASAGVRTSSGLRRPQEAPDLGGEAFGYFHVTLMPSATQRRQPRGWNPGAEVFSHLTTCTLIYIAVEQQCGYLDERQNVAQVSFGKCARHHANPNGMIR